MMEFHAEIEMPEQKVGRGGAREGAGRKCKDVHHYGFRACQRGTRHPFLSFPFWATVPKECRSVVASYKK
ncbi:MAG: hypothetical protein IJR84_00475 [Bacteroidaceae bacterium]|nr:hypothetical protein [Bacteroidaceae bacterium]